MFFKISILKNFRIFTGKQLCWNLWPAILFKRGSNIGAFLWILRNFLRAAFLWNTTGGCFYNIFFKDTLNVFDDYKNKQKSFWSNVFWYVKVWIFWNCIEQTIHWDKTQMLQKFPSDKINSTKNAFFFLSRAPSHHCFTLICDCYMNKSSSL